MLSCHLWILSCHLGMLSSHLGMLSGPGHLGVPCHLRMSLWHSCSCAVWHSLGVRVERHGAGRDVSVVGISGRDESLSDHLLYLLLSFLLELLVFVLRVPLIVLLVKRLPTGIVVVFFPLGLGQELVVRDEFVPVGVGLLEDMLAHALHLLDAHLHVIVLVVGIVHLIQLLLEENLDLILVPMAVPVEIVHGEERLGVPVLGPHVVLLLPNLLQLFLGHRMVRGLVLFVLLRRSLVI